MSKEIDRIKLRRWRKRGFYSESVLVKILQKKGYNAVRVPVSNPSLNPLPDLMARRGPHVYAFEVKNASYYAYFPKPQIDKLFRFLDQFIPAENSHKHAVVAAHLGKRWLFKEISWNDWQRDKIPDKVRILKRDRGNLNIDTSYQTWLVNERTSTLLLTARQTFSFESAYLKGGTGWLNQMR